MHCCADILYEENSTCIIQAPARCIYYGAVKESFVRKPLYVLIECHPNLSLRKKTNNLRERNEEANKKLQIYLQYARIVVVSPP